jgi:hypothetical protein
MGRSERVPEAVEDPAVEVLRVEVQPKPPVLPQLL